MKIQELNENERPQDPHLDGSGWSFETCEHGGHIPDCMPQAIVATDHEGKRCVYVPLKTDDGKPGRQILAS